MKTMRSFYRNDRHHLSTGCVEVPGGHLCHSASGVSGLVDRIRMRFQVQDLSATAALLP